MTLLTRQPQEILERVARDLIVPLPVLQRKAIESAMILCEGNISEAARRLRVHRTQLCRILAKYRKEDS
jgi:ActR/RegA family two-component response regulator